MYSFWVSLKDCLFRFESDVISQTIPDRLLDQRLVQVARAFL